MMLKDDGTIVMNEIHENNAKDNNVKGINWRCIISLDYLLFYYIFFYLYNLTFTKCLFHS